MEDILQSSTTEQSTSTKSHARSAHFQLAIDTYKVHNRCLQFHFVIVLTTSLEDSFSEASHQKFHPKHCHLTGLLSSPHNTKHPGIPLNSFIQKNDLVSKVSTSKPSAHDCPPLTTTSPRVMHVSDTTWDGDDHPVVCCLNCQ